MLANSDILEKNKIFNGINLKYYRKFLAQMYFQEKSWEFFYVQFLISRHLTKVIVLWIVEVKFKRLPFYKKNYI